MEAPKILRRDLYGILMQSEALLLYIVQLLQFCDSYVCFLHADHPGGSQVFDQKKLEYGKSDFEEQAFHIAEHTMTLIRKIAELQSCCIVEHFKA